MPSTNNRYNAKGYSETELQPGSQDVLKNKLGITSITEMDDAEMLALKNAQDYLLQTITQDHRFSAKDICSLQEVWLESIYPWAGQYRTVDISKSDFMFAHAVYIPQLMNEFEKTVLANNTPCRFDSHTKIAQALAETHIELILIHPFREGNGRVARVLATLMAAQAGLPLLRFDVLDKNKQDYFAAIQAGLSKNYLPLEKLFTEIISETLAQNPG